jgi:hypothetical protein
MNWARQSVNGACHAVASECRRHRRPHIMLRAPDGHSGGRTEAFCIAILDVVIAKTEAPYQMADSSQTGTSGNSGAAFLGVPGILFFFLGLRDLLGLFAWPFADIAEIAARAALPLTRCGSVLHAALNLRPAAISPSTSLFSYSRPTNCRGLRVRLALTLFPFYFFNTQSARKCHLNR